MRDPRTNEADDLNEAQISGNRAKKKTTIPKDAFHAQYVWLKSDLRKTGEKQKIKEGLYREAELGMRREKKSIGFPTSIHQAKYVDVSGQDGEFISPSCDYAKVSTN